MATSYESWAKYDVDAELARVDKQAQRDEAHRVAQQHKLAKQSVEDAVSTSAEQSAQVLAAHAAVAVLKAKARAKRQQTPGGGASASELRTQHDLQSIGSSNQSETTGENAVAERLQRQSELFRAKHELMQRIMERRREGEAILQSETRAGNEDVVRALQLLNEALASARELEKIAPELIQAEREPLIPTSSFDAQINQSGAHDSSSNALSSGESQQSHQDHRHDGHDCGDDASQCSHSHPKQGKPKRNEVLPKADDLDAILKMVFKDIFMAMGACHLQLERLAAASNAFKEVLLRDDRHVPAWLERGSAFERMGATLLAMLHFSRATALDLRDENAVESLERVKETLLSGSDDIIGADAIVRKIESLTRSTSLASLLSVVYLTFQEANVLMVEGFFQYATPKYQIVLGCIEFVLASPDLCTKESRDVVAEIHASLRQVRTASRLNIAGGYHEMQRSQLRGVDYCAKILESSSDDESSATVLVQSVGHFRIGQLLRSAHDYERAMEHLELSRKLLVDSQSSKQQQEALKKIEKEIDRCAFDRSQHDLAFIRSLLEQQ